MLRRGFRGEKYVFEWDADLSSGETTGVMLHYQDPENCMVFGLEHVAGTTVQPRPGAPQEWRLWHDCDRLELHTDPRRWWSRTAEIVGADDINDDGTPDVTGIAFGNRSGHYYWGGMGVSPVNWRVIEERDNDGSAGRVLAQTVYGTEYIDEPVCRDRNLDVSTDSTPASDDCLDGSGGTSGSVRYFYHQDANYRVAALTNEAGTVVERYEYEAYGEPRIYAGCYGAKNYESGALVSTSYVGNPLMHQGLRRDDETGLHENRYRMLHSRLGRFMQRDPMGYSDGLSLVAALDANPIFNVDPLGNLIQLVDDDLVWHHMLPQEWRKFFLRIGINIDNPAFGRIMTHFFHSALHALGWNSEWIKFLRGIEALEGKVPNELLRELVLQHLDTLTREFGNILKYGAKAVVPYRSGWLWRATVKGVDYVVKSDTLGVVISRVGRGAALRGISRGLGVLFGVLGSKYLIVIDLAQPCSADDIISPGLDPTSLLNDGEVLEPVGESGPIF